MSGISPSCNVVSTSHWPKSIANVPHWVPPVSCSTKSPSRYQSTVPSSWSTTIVYMWNKSSSGTMFADCSANRKLPVVCLISNCIKFPPVSLESWIIRIPAGSPAWSRYVESIHCSRFASGKIAQKLYEVSFPVCPAKKLYCDLLPDVPKFICPLVADPLLYAVSIIPSTIVKSATELLTSPSGIIAGGFVEVKSFITALSNFQYANSFSVLTNSLITVTVSETPTVSTGFLFISPIGNSNPAPLLNSDVISVGVNTLDQIDHSSNVALFVVKKSKLVLWNNWIGVKCGKVVPADAPVSVAIKVPFLYHNTSVDVRFLVTVYMENDVQFGLQLTSTNPALSCTTIVPPSKTL